MPRRPPPPKPPAAKKTSPPPPPRFFVCILVLASSLLPSPARAQCGEHGMFACREGEQCVPQYKNCDTHIDCPDGSDEFNCTDDFDSRFWDHLYKKRPNADLDEQPQLCELEQPPPMCLCYGRDLLCDNAGLRAPPAGLPQRGVRTLDLSGNWLYELNASVLAPVPDVTTLILAHAGVRKVHADAFRNRTALRHLHLNNNVLRDLPEPTFPPDSGLETLYLSHNRFIYLPAGVFQNLKNLTELDLRHNYFTEVCWEALRPLDSLSVLYMNENLLDRLGPAAFPPLPQLQTLSLAHNRIGLVAAAAFLDLPALQHLYLNNNLLKELRNGTFANLTRLRSLKLNANQLIAAETGAFEGLKALVSLDLQENKLEQLDQRLLQHLTRLQYVYFDDFRLCAAARHVRVCEPHGDGISSLDHLLDNALLRASVWAMALVACAGNLLVLLGRLLMREPNAVHSLYIMNLALSDLLMGCYLFAIAAADWRFRGRYVLVEAEWRRSPACSFCGFLSTLSAASSVLILALITWDRLASVARPLARRRGGRPSVRAAAAQAAALWAVALLVAALPLSRARPFGRAFYGGNGVCLPLHIHDPYAQGWQYSAGVFVGGYALALAFICCAYWHMLRAIRSSGLALRSTQERQDRAVAQRFALIVFTDCACWAPVIVAKLLALAGVRVQQDLYAWLAVCVMPVNSALNPVLYTLTTQLFKQQAGRLLCAWRRCGVPLSTKLDSALSLSTLKDGGSRRRLARTPTTGSSTLNNSCSSWKSREGAAIRGTPL